ncbi:MAG: MFS transporter [Gammaproteobacteria bacterium]|nr:MFS transporter [Gammaproteobacteria bacterium]
MTSVRTSTSSVPYWRLSAFYFFYFAAIGVILPYWPLYLESIDFNARAIGELTAILLGSKIIAPYIWGWIADRHGQRMRIVRIASLFAAVIYAGVLLDDSFLWLALIMMLFGFFWHAALPQFEATTMNHLGDSTHAYTRIRVWGSIGFILPVITLGYIFEAASIDYLPLIMLMCLSLIFIASLLVPETAAGHLHLDSGSIWTHLKKPQVLALLGVCFLMQMSHAPYYTFYSVYLEDNGYGRAFIGNMWALGVVAEVLVFVLMYSLIHRFGLKILLITSLVLAGVRWLLIGYAVTSISLLLVAQLLHAASFGLYHATAIQFIHRYFTGRMQGRGQALYSSVSFGAGVSLGSLLVGHSWQSLGATFSFTVAAVLTALAAFIAWRWVILQSPGQAPA